MITVILLILATFLYYLYWKRRYSYWNRRGIQGPASSILAGRECHSEFRCDGREIEKCFLRKYGQCFGTYSRRERLFNTSVPEHIKQVLGDVNTFQNFGLIFVRDKYIHRSLFFLNGARWKEHRSAMTHHFTSRKLRSLLSHFESVANNFIANIELQREGGQTDVFEIRKMCKCYAVDLISKYVFAVDIDSFKQDQKNSEFAKLALRIGDFNLIHRILLEIVPKFLWKWLNLNIFDVEPVDKLGDLFKKMIRQRDPNLRYNDLAELFQDQIKNGKLSDMCEDDIISNCLLSFFAGTDSSSNALTKVFYYLVIEPEVRQRLQTELRSEFKNGISYEALVEHRLLDAFVSECLRLRQSLLTLDRLVTKDCQLGDYHLEKGTVVNLVTYLNHVNAEYFPNPEKFDPNRFLDKSSSNPNQIHRSEIYAPFSSGSRQCIGMRFALLEIKYLVVRVLLEYDLFKPEAFKLEEVSRWRVAVPIRMNVGLRKRAVDCL